MKYDFESMIDRRGMDAMAIEDLGKCRASARSRPGRAST